VILNLVVFLYFLGIIPKVFFDRIAKGKKHPEILQRLGFSIPDNRGKPVIWMHAVSVGEVKSSQPLFVELKKIHPDAFFLITTTSATGQAEAKRSLKDADGFAYLPLDLTWIVNRWVDRLRPQLLILVESDFWPHLLKSVKKKGGRIALVSGKISQRSARRFKRFPFFSKMIFSHIDLFCVQNEEYYNRFLPLVPDPSRMQITGNLKLDVQSQSVDISFWQGKLQLPKKPIITISCTHAPEEELLLGALANPDWFFFLAPRHPERFDEVAEILTQREIPFIRWSQIEKMKGGEAVILVDAMGQLPICYTFSRLAIVAGSYIDRIGGHNVLEPCLYGTPVFFGPHMFGQTEFADRVSKSKAGMQIPLQNLRSAVDLFLKDSIQEKSMRAAAVDLIRNSRGTVIRTLQSLQGFLQPPYF